MRLSTPRCFGWQIETRQKGMNPIADSVPTFHCIYASILHRELMDLDIFTRPNLLR